MKTINMKIQVKTLIFFTAYILFMFYKIINTSTYSELIPDKLIDYIKFISWSLFMVKIIFYHRKDYKQNILFSILFILSLIIRKYSGSSEIFELVLVGFAASDIDFKYIAKVTLYEILIMCIIIILSSITGIIPNYTFLRSNGNVGFALGFIYVGKLSIYLQEFMLLDMYLSERKNQEIKNTTILLYFLLLTIVFVVSYIRNTYIISCILLLSYIFVKKVKIVNLLKIKKLISIVYIVCFALVYFLVVNYNSNNNFYSKINSLLNTRLSVMNRVYNNYEVSPFGTEIVMKGFNAINEKYTYVDSAYISILIKNGYVISMIIALFYTLFIRKCIDANMYTLALWLIFLSLSSIIEDSLIQINFNCLILLLFVTKKNFNEVVKGEEYDRSSCSNIQ